MKQKSVPVAVYRLQILDGEEPNVGKALYVLPSRYSELEAAKGVARDLYRRTRLGWKGRKVYGVRVVDADGKRQFEKTFVAEHAGARRRVGTGTRLTISRMIGAPLKGPGVIFSPGEEMLPFNFLAAHDPQLVQLWGR
jgi:hypothetical protein